MSGKNEQLKVRINGNVDIYERISSPQEAFLVSRMTTRWMTSQELQQGCASYSEEEFTSILQRLIENDVIITEDFNETHTEQTTTLEIKVPVEREYPQIETALFSMSTSLKNIPKNALKEILFLSRYGKSIDFYRRLNFQKNPFTQTQKTIEKQIFAFTKFHTKMEEACASNEKILGHIRKSKEAIAITALLLDAEKRKEYDEKMVKQGTYKLKEKHVEKENSIPHYSAAVQLLEKGKLQEAMREINIAIRINPEKALYQSAKENIFNQSKKNKVKVLLLRIEKNESVMWDERLLNKTLDELFELNNFVATRIKVAKILMKKGAFQIALTVLNEAAPTDKETRKDVTSLQKELRKQYKSAQSKFK